MKCSVICIAFALALAAICSAASVSEPESLALTVYNGNFALVKDTRAIDLNAGVNSIDVEDVAAKIDPTSVLFKSLTAPDSVEILEQNYQYDLISPDNILNKSVGERVTFTSYNADGSVRQVSGELLSPPANGGIVIKTNEHTGGMTINPSGQIEIDKMPEGLHPRPTLNWLLKSDKAGTQTAQISYITDGIGWKADYVALVNKNDTALDLAGWVTLNNESGATYDNAKLTLMAGDVRRLQQAQPRAAMAKASYLEEAAPQFQEKSFFEYHMYTMQRPADIRNNETKQLSLLNASNAPVTKEMTYDARGDWFRSWWYPGRNSYDPGSGYDTSDYHKVNVTLELKNSKENNMGMPLPAGKIRVYKLDDNGSQQFIGEDSIDHTPKDEKIRLYIGDAFDVVGDYKRTDYKKIAANVVQESFEVKIRNHKDVPVEVKIIDHVWSDWKVTQASHDYNKLDASTIAFPVKVPKDGETTVTYTIRTSW
ncbi:MAG: DUF4139 domain-containing protein [Armatimonadota bacterium]|nr:DUF4139 domain-containing protein [bacterium]